MSQSADAAIDRWYDIVKGHTTRGPLTASNILVRGDLLYSYGTHFELARPLRDKKGEILAFLLNGDTYSNTTSGHQSHVRGRLSKEQTVIIPHSALNSAGIDLESIRIVHVKPDTHTTTHHRTTERPPRSKWVDHPIYETVDLSDEEIEVLLDEKHADLMQTYNYKVRWHEEAIARGDGNIWKREVDAGPPARPTRDMLDSWRTTKRVVVGNDRKLHRNGRDWGDEIEVETLPDGTVEYSWDVTRHWLGEALIKARVTWITQETCPDCGGKGTHPFTGDEWDARCRRCFGNWGRNMGTVPKAHHRWAYYLSGFDHEEARPLYFFAELPRGVKPETVAEAYEALKPDPVRMAEQMNRPVFRQGDIFGVPLEAMDRKALKALGARIEKRTMREVELEPVQRVVREANLPYVLNTNHTATEVAYLPDGVTLARGTMYHDPEGRRADHARRRIGDGKTWHVVIKNTVPISRR
ncbi:MAG: hypothetical protein ACXVYB_00250 [Arthrobacter sp.]